MFKKVCIIGCGLIGSSLARAIRKNNLAEKIVSSNRSDSINKTTVVRSIFFKKDLMNQRSCSPISSTFFYADTSGKHPHLLLDRLVKELPQMRTRALYRYS